MRGKAGTEQKNRLSVPIAAHPQGWYSLRATGAYHRQAPAQRRGKANDRPLSWQRSDLDHIEIAQKVELWYTD